MEVLCLTSHEDLLHYFETGELCPVACPELLTVSPGPSESPESPATGRFKSKKVRKRAIYWKQWAARKAGPVVKYVWSEGRLVKAE